MDIIFNIFPIVFVLLAAFQLFVGFQVLSRKKPLLFSAKWLFGIMGLSFAPVIISNFASVFFFDLYDGFNWLWMLTPLWYSALLVFFWFQMRGYILIGVKDEAMQEALMYALKEENIRYESALTKINLVDHNVQLHVSVQDWVGSGQIKLSDRKHNELLKRITVKMKHYFISNDVPVNNLTAIMYLLGGVFVLIAAMWFWFWLPF